MPIFEHEERGVRFEVVDKPTVEQQLLYLAGMTQARNENLFLGYWEAAKPLIKKWTFKEFKDHNADLSKLTDPAITEVIIWAGLKVMNFMNGLDEVDKKSSSSGGGDSGGGDEPAT